MENNTAHKNLPKWPNNSLSRSNTSAKENENTPPDLPRKIAPGLVKLKPKRDEGVHYGRELYQTMRAVDYTADEDEPAGAWNNFGVNLPGANLKDVKQLFYSNEELLNRHSQPKNRLEANNKTTLALGSKSQSIVNVIGGKEIGTTVLGSEDRFKYLNDSGEYKDGVDRGQIKKRLRDEFECSISIRKDEMLHASAVLREWASLPEEEKERRRENARFNMAEMLKAVELVELDEIPKDYTDKFQNPFDFIQLENDDVSQSMNQSVNQMVGQSSANVSTEETRPLSSPTAPTATYPVFKKPRVSAVRPGKGRQKEWSSSQTTPQYTTTTSTPISRSIPSSGSATPTGSRKDHRRLGAAWPTLKKPKRVPPPPPPQSDWSETSRNSFFTVGNKEPEITPLEDVPAGQELNGDLMAKYQKAVEQSTMRGRLVVLKLQPEIKFTTEVVASRIQGGHVQEFQFFPNEHQAVIAFLFPWEAEAFLKHIQMAREKSDHEFRRLQISAEWYRGLEIDSVYPGQKHLIAKVLGENASRAVRIDGISKEIKKDMLLEVFKQHFPDLVRLRLVVPKKRYEQEREDSNMMILEFNSILKAADAYTRFNTHAVKEFESCTVTWLQDPCTKPRATQPWCDCLHCVEQLTNLGEGSVSDLESIAIRGGRHSMHLESKKNQDLEYDPELDAMVPKSFRTSYDRIPGFANS